MMILQPSKPLSQLVSKMVDVRVIVEKWGTYKKGDILTDVPDSTALACIKAGVVEDASEEEKTKVVKPTKKEKK